MWKYLFYFSFILSVHAGNVNEITTANFENTVKNSNNLWILEFYSPTCPYCQDFAPEYEQVGNALAGSKIKVGRVDGVHNDQLSEKYHIRGYPTVKMFRPQSPTPEDYNGPRVASTIVDTAKALAQEKRIRSFGDVFLTLPQTRRVSSSKHSNGSLQTVRDEE